MLSLRRCRARCVQRRCTLRSSGLSIPAIMCALLPRASLHILHTITDHRGYQAIWRFRHFQSPLCHSSCRRRTRLPGADAGRCRWHSQSARRTLQNHRLAQYQEGRFMSRQPLPTLVHAAFLRSVQQAQRRARPTGCGYGCTETTEYHR